jgi:hypothetical protein
MTNERTVPACSRLLEAVNRGELVHDGDPVLEAHVEAGTIEMTERGARIAKAPRGKVGRGKIDALIGLLLAFTIAADQSMNGTSVYENRDLLVLSTSFKGERMGLFDRFSKRDEPSVDFVNEDVIYLEGPYAGERVDYKSSMRLIPVWACVQLIAGTMGSLPLRVYRTDSTGAKVETPDHRVARLLRNPNPYMAGDELS